MYELDNHSDYCTKTCISSVLKRLLQTECGVDAALPGPEGVVAILMAGAPPKPEVGSEGDAAGSCCWTALPDGTVADARD